MIRFDVIGTDAVVARLGEIPRKASSAAVDYLHNFSARLAAYIVADKLSGSPLHRRSGRLSSSVHPFTDVSTDTITGGAGAGRDVPYAFIHEYGGQIDHPGGTAYIYKNGIPQFISNEAAASMPWLPRTAPHIINMPERSYMRSSLRDMGSEGVAGLRLAVVEAILQ